MKMTNKINKSYKDNNDEEMFLSGKSSCQNDF